MALIDCSALDCDINDLLAVPVAIYNFLLGLAGFVALAVIIWSGVRMLLFYLAESPEQELNNAKMTLTRGIVGVVIIAAAYLIVALVLDALGVKSGYGVGAILNQYGIDW